MNWNDWINYEIFHLGDFRLIVGNVITSLLIIVFTWGFIKAVRRFIVGPKNRLLSFEQKRRLSVFIITKYLIWIISLILVLDVIGIKITVLLVGSTALLVGLGLGIQSIFKDLVSGLFLLFEGTIKIGDIIEVDGIIGKVTEINLRSSKIETREDFTIIIPNSKFITENVVNWSHNNERVRFKVDIRVAYGTDIDKVISVFEEAMMKNEKILDYPQPYVRFTNFGESSLEFDLIFWTMDTFRVENTKSNLRRAVYQSLKENEIIIPFPQRDIHIKGLEQILTNEKENG